MVAHLVHKNAEGKLAVVAVLLDKGGANLPTIETIWTHIPKEKEKEAAPDVTVDAATLLPSERGYYAFQGSLTTPPCSEEVRWLVLKHPVKIADKRDRGVRQALSDERAAHPAAERPPRRSHAVISSARPVEGISTGQR